MRICVVTFNPASKLQVTPCEAINKSGKNTKYIRDSKEQILGPFKVQTFKASAAASGPRTHSARSSQDTLALNLDSDIVK